MNSRKLLFCLACLFLLVMAFLPTQHEAKEEQRYLYVASPGIRNYTEFGGVGILVFDINNNHKFVKRIRTGNRDKQPKTSRASKPAHKRRKSISARRNASLALTSSPKKRFGKKNMKVVLTACRFRLMAKSYMCLRLKKSTGTRSMP
jgi:hypothetical protein